jgi:hypothetical protein
MDGRRDLTMATPIDAVRLHSTFGEPDFWLRAEDRTSSPLADEQGNLSPARGAVLGLFLGCVMWVGLILAARAVLGL